MIDTLTGADNAARGDHDREEDKTAVFCRVQARCGAPGTRQGLSIARVAHDLDVAESALGRWAAKAREQGAETLTGTALTPEQLELRRLRRENQILKQERDILKRAAACFAKESL